MFYISNNIIKSYRDEEGAIMKDSVQLSAVLFVCVEILWPSQPNGVMSSMVSLPSHTFTGQA